jgi:hypothetical protein
MVAYVRDIGIDRILFGSDSLPGVAADNPPAHRQWEWVRGLPLTDRELATLASNCTPWME